MAFTRLAARGSLGMALWCPIACAAAGGCAEGGGDEAACVAHSRSLLQARFQSIEDVGLGAALEGGAPPQLLEEGGLGGVPKACAWYTCLNFHDPKREQNCAACVAEATGGQGTAEVGVNGVTAGFVIDQLKLFGDRSPDNYARHFCGDDFGDLSACPETKSHLGTAINSYGGVAEMLSKLPAKEWSGEWWRGNELGDFIMNPFFWSGMGINPAANVLGITPKQHAAIRPIMEEMLTLGRFSPHRKSGVQAIVTRAITGFLEEGRTQGLALKGDLFVLVHQILFEVTFGTPISSKDARMFGMLQSKMLALGMFTQTLPAELYAYFVPVRDMAAGYVKQYAGLLKERFGERLAEEDCSPSESCLTQLAAAVFENMLSGGGVGLPTSIATGLAILFSEHGSNPFPGASFSSDKAKSFYWEVLRYFAVGPSVPLWERRPTCAGLTEAQTAALKAEPCPLGADDKLTKFPKVNQYQGGERFLANIALAQKDVNAWGPDANEFVLRELKQYEEKSLSFAEKAVDDSVAGGRMNRVCAGKDLALMIGSTFFELFNKGDYELASAKDLPLLIGGPSWVLNFKLSPKTMA